MRWGDSTTTSGNKYYLGNVSLTHRYVHGGNYNLNAIYCSNQSDFPSQCAYAIQAITV